MAFAIVQCPQKAIAKVFVLSCSFLCAAWVRFRAAVLDLLVSVLCMVRLSLAMMGKGAQHALSKDGALTDALLGRRQWGALVVDDRSPETLLWRVTASKAPRLCRAGFAS